MTPNEQQRVAFADALGRAVIDSYEGDLDEDLHAIAQVDPDLSEWLRDSLKRVDTLSPADSQVVTDALLEVLASPTSMGEEVSTAANAYADGRLMAETVLAVGVAAALVLAAARGQFRLKRSADGRFEVSYQGRSDLGMVKAVVSAFGSALAPLKRVPERGK